jgi:Tfp pilus assembly protein PilF
VPVCNRRVHAVARVVAVVLAGLVLAACGKSSGGDSVAKLLDKGVTAQRAGDLKGAQKDYENALKKDPRNKFAFYNLGLIAQVTGDKPTAETDYRQAVSIDPKFALALYNLAIVRNSVGDTTSAITFYRQAIAADPNNPAPHFNLGLILRANGKKAEGDTQIARAVALNPSLFSRAPKDTAGLPGGSARSGGPG